MSHKPTAGSLSVRERGGADRNMILYAIAFIISPFKLDLSVRHVAFNVICIIFHHPFSLYTTGSRLASWNWNDVNIFV